MDALGHALSGLIGACYATTLTYPLEVVKTRITTQSVHDDKKTYNGIVDGLGKIYRQEGIQGLYLGLQGQYVQTSIANFSYFFLYEAIKAVALDFKRANAMSKTSSAPSLRPKIIKQQSSFDSIASPSQANIHTSEPTTTVGASNGKNELQIQLNIFENILVGIIAGIIQQLLISPLNVALVRIKTKRPPADSVSGLLAVIKAIFVREGLKSLYAGLGPAMILTLNPAIQFMVFDQLKTMMQSSPVFSAIYKHSIINFLLGAFSKIVATFVTYPYVMAKTRMQSKSTSSSSIGIMLKVFRASGFAGLYSGLRATLLKAVLFSALLFMVKEKFHHFTVKYILSSRV